MFNELNSGYDPKNSEIITDCPDALKLLFLSAYWAILGDHDIKTEEGRLLIEGVGRVLVATSSKDKLDGVLDFFCKFLCFVRGENDILVKPTACPGCEPPDDEAVLVALDKAFRAIDHLCNGDSDLKEGAKAVVVGLDAVVRAGAMKPDGSLELQHLINLSRIKDDRGDISLDKQVAMLREIYCTGPSVVEYDLAAVASVRIKDDPKKEM